MPNFKARGFKLKEIYFMVFSISSVYFFTWIRHLPVKVTWWFLGSDGSEIQAKLIKISHQIYATFFLILNKVLSIRGMWVVYFSIHKLQNYAGSWRINTYYIIESCGDAIGQRHNNIVSKRGQYCRMHTVWKM